MGAAQAGAAPGGRPFPGGAAPASGTFRKHGTLRPSPQRHQPHSPSPGNLQCGGLLQLRVGSIALPVACSGPGGPWATWSPHQETGGEAPGVRTHSSQGRGQVERKSGGGAQDWRRGDSELAQRAEAGCHVAPSGTRRTHPRVLHHSGETDSCLIHQQGYYLKTPVLWLGKNRAG